MVLSQSYKTNSVMALSIPSPPPPAPAICQAFEDFSCPRGEHVLQQITLEAGHSQGRYYLICQFQNTFIFRFSLFVFFNFPIASNTNMFIKTELTKPHWSPACFKHPEPHLWKTFIISGLQSTALRSQNFSATSMLKEAISCV